VKNRVPVLIAIACLVMAFIAFEVYSVLSVLNDRDAAAPQVPTAAADTAAAAPAPGPAAPGPGGSAPGSPPPGGAAGPDGGGMPNPEKPTVSYPELCLGLVEIDHGKASARLTPAQKKKILGLLAELDRSSQQVHHLEASVMDSLSEPQRQYIQDNRQKLMQASVTPGKPPISYALNYFKGQAPDARP